MQKPVDPLGELLTRSGILDEEAVADVLEHQRRPLPFASLCYLLGYASEETLVRALARQCGVRGVLLESCVIKLRVFEGVPRQTYVRHDLIPLFEDDRRLFVGAAAPQTQSEVLRELEFVKGKAVIPLVGLRIALARALRDCFAALDRGDSTYAGPAADRHEAGPDGDLVTVSEFEDLATDKVEAEAHQAVLIDVTSEVHADDLVLIDSADEPPPEWLAEDRGDRTEEQEEPSSVTRPEMVHPGHLYGGTGTVVPGLTETAERATSAAEKSAPRVLIVDSDYDTRHLLVRELQPLGYHAMTAQCGSEAVKRLKHDPPDALILDVMLPEIDGYQICRAVKLSRRYRHIRVLLISEEMTSSPVTDAVLRRHGADAYLQKPIDPARLKARLRDLLRSQERDRVPQERERDDGFEKALQLYRRGRIDEAIEVLRSGVSEDPLSAKHHFVLANLLQKKSMVYEAIDEYEATVDLKPDYFPALTRLAYLYYKQGFAARAIETWRRALPHCPDAALREQIEVFMRKLITEMQSEA